jgi:hypothetical protein
MNIIPVPGSISSPEKLQIRRSGILITPSAGIQLPRLTTGIAYHQNIPDSNRAADIPADDSTDIPWIRCVIDSNLDLGCFASHAGSSNNLDDLCGPRFGCHLSRLLNS